MAISDSFYGLRRKSTKSHTYASYRGEQVTKTRVTAPANPQSTGQMVQRLKMPMVSAVRTRLSPILNHSFEGIEYGQKSLRYFSSLNLKAGNLNASVYVPKGSSNTGVADFIISKGSLLPYGQSIASTITSTETTTINYASDIEGIRLPLYSPTFEKTEVADVISELADNFKRSYQFVGDDFLLTAIMGQAKGFVRYKINNGNYRDYLQSFAALRFFVSSPEKNVLKGSGSNGWALGTLTIGEESLKRLDYYEDDYPIFSIIMIPTTSNIGVTPGSVVFEVRSAGGSPEGTRFSMGAVIVSGKQGSVWRRSTNRFLVNNINIYKHTFEEVLPSYLSNANTSGSDKYLNDGDESTGIEGGTIETLDF